MKPSYIDQREKAIIFDFNILELKKLLKMNYTVRYLDTLPKIAKEQLGDESRWHELAAFNGLKPPVLLYVGERLAIPPKVHPSLMVHKAPRAIQPVGRATGGVEHNPSTQILGRAFFFILADEINPFTRKLVRKG